MTYTLTTHPTRYTSYQDYLDDEQLSSERNYRLLSTGELIEVASEDDLNLRIGIALLMRLVQWQGGLLKDSVRNGNKEIQVPPTGDQCVNRKPDVMVLHPDHLIIAKQAILLGMVPPLFVAEVVSPGNENSDSYQRDYVWKRQQYEGWGIAEYWIIDPHRDQVTALYLVEGTYQAEIYKGSQQIDSKVFSALSLTAEQLLRGQMMS
ncbi:MAG: hypothetical protein DCF15_06460 [Phormidesmis priestleyi]|uniref:Putative restriction endonuclease domain-containing protein n=1 Tax=Phormidesmis priestleyi TaxID=268141 RepID=A0A2W4ZGZ6_9CYAN|nr:MAG: hypothetical protein DCF15_06460 [Phormidesmis priestleyi]